jgi:hypothetical protein
MNLGEYFDGAKGQGVLATADGSGKVNVAVYARPHFVDDETALFIMADRLSHENLSSNPSAAYIFIETGAGWTGKRLYLKKMKEEKNDELVNEICRRCNYSQYDTKNRYVVYFKVEKELPLIGG